MPQCVHDSDCPFLHYCYQQNQCLHKPIFPLEPYTIFIYLLMPFACGIVNMAGNCMGVFKVLIFINFLRYSNLQATAYVQPAVVGAGLCNLLNIIFKQHPYRKAPLIDYNLLHLMIPSSLLGSTVGSFAEKFIPDILEDILVIGFFSYFVKQFYAKIKAIKHKQKQQDLRESVLTENEQEDCQSLQNYSTANNYSSSDSDDDIKLTQQELSHKDAIIAYESSMRIKDIFLSFLVFFVFQFFVFLVQGKLSFYQVKLCSLSYSFGMVGLIVLTVTYLYFTRNKLRRQYKLYRKFGIKFDIDLCKKKVSMAIIFGGLLAGFVQGILGVGSGTVVMLVLLTYNFDARVASATSGFQIFFIGAASFVQAFLTNQITLKDGLFVFLNCFILGGIATLLFYSYLKNKSEDLVQKILILIICILCMISLIGMIPYIIQNLVQYGFSQLFEIGFHC